MKEENCFIADDGTIHRTREAALVADAWLAIDSLIETTVPYHEGREIVRTFLREHNDFLYPLLRNTHYNDARTKR